MARAWRWGLIAVLTMAARASGARAADPPLPPPLALKDFTAPPRVSMPKLSPSGKHLAFVKRVGEIDQIIDIELSTMKARLVFQTKVLAPDLVKKKYRQNVSFLDWKSDGMLLTSVDTPIRLVIGDQEQIIAAPIHVILDVETDAAPTFLNYSKGAGGKVELSWIQTVLRSDPGHLIIGVRPTLNSLQLFRVDVHTGQRTLLEQGGDSVVGYGVDHEGNIVTRTLDYGTGSLILEGRGPGEKAWKRVLQFRKEQRELEKYEFLGLGDVGVLYVAARPETAQDGDTKTVHSFDLKTQKLGPVLWSNPTYDADGIVQDEDSGKILAGCYWAEIYRCEFSSPKIAANMKALGKFFNDSESLFIVSQSDDADRWIVATTGPDDPGGYYLYDAVAHRIERLGDEWPELTPGRLATVRKLPFRTRDGVELAAYVTEPPGPAPAAPRALVVMPHGGPEVSDHYDFDWWTQYLASRGYVVLQPNFRGSGGFGRKFAEAGYGQWGQRMHEDVMDATRALMAEGRVDPARVCIVGASYGGYEALYAAAKEPATFKCAISVDGVSDLTGVMKWERLEGRDTERYAYWSRSIGDPDKEAERMQAHSPFRLAASYTTPVLLIHGDKDTIVPVEESRQMNRALAAAGKKVRYVEVRDMGHGPDGEEETTKVFGEIAAFLATYLDGGAPVAAKELH